MQYLILTFKLRLNNVFWHSQPYFEIRFKAQYRILTFKILCWHSNIWTSKCDIRPSSKVKIGIKCQNTCPVRMSNICQNSILNVKHDIPPQFECQNRNWTSKYMPMSNVKIGYWCPNKIFGLSLNGKKGYWFPYTKFGLSSNGKVGYWCQNTIFQPQFEWQNMILMSKCDKRPQFEWQKRILISIY